MIVSIEGQAGTCKSGFAYTSPLPIVAFSPDMGHDRAIYGSLFPEFFQGLDIKRVTYVAPTMTAQGKFSEVKYEPYSGHDITIYEMPVPMQMDPDKLTGFMEQWMYFIKIFSAAVTDPAVSTILLDTATLLRKLKINAYLQELQGQGKARKQLQQIEYGHPDGEIRTLYTMANGLRKNMVAIHHVRDHYSKQMTVDGKIETSPDGTFEIDGVKDTEKMVDILMRTEAGKNTVMGSLVKAPLTLIGSQIPLPTWDRLINVLSSSWYGEPYPRRKTETEGVGK